MHKIIQLISNFLYNKRMSPSMKTHVHWVDLMKTKKYKNFKVLKFWHKGLQAKGLIFLIISICKNIMFNEFKMFSFRCRWHVQELILPKKHVWFFNKTHLKFFRFFCIFDYKPKYWYTIMYAFEKSQTSHE